MASEKYDSRPLNMTPYERLRWQATNCTEHISGYAVAVASERTKRAAYLTGNGTELTNNEHKAAILPRPEASALMANLYECGEWYAGLCRKIAFLVPVSAELPLTMCTFAGH